MPFTLCKSERRRIDELVDHVNGLSDIVDELKAKVETMKICTKITSNESLNQRRNSAEFNTLQKLKKCLQRNLISVFSRDPPYKVRKKYQQMSSQMPTIIPRPVNSPENHQHFLSSSDAKRKIQKIPTSSQRSKNITDDSLKAQQLGITSSSSRNSKDFLKSPHRVYNPSCSNDTSNFSKTPRKNENVSQLKRGIAKNKTAEASTTTNLSPIKIATPKSRLIDSETIQRRRSVTFVDREKKTSLDKSSSIISSLSNSNNVHSNVIRDKPKNETNFEKKTLNSTQSGPQVKQKKKKISRSAQCSIDCEYQKKLPVHLKNAYTSTNAYNLSPDNKSIDKDKLVKNRRKSLANKSTQTTLKLDKHTDKICSNGRKQYCSKAKRSCISAGSQSTLTSCSPRSISSFCLGSEELGEGLMYRYYKREAIPQKKKLKKKQKTKITEEDTDNVRKARKAEVFSLRESTKLYSKLMNNEPNSSRRKRTYLISSNVPVKKNDEGGQCNLDEEQANYSSDGISTFPKSELKQRKNKKKRKKSDELPKKSEIHQVQNKQQSSPDERNNYICTSVCQKNQTEQRFVPKLKRRSNWTVGKQHKKSIQTTKLHENTSSSSYACTEETCSLTSDPQISTSDESVTSKRLNRNKKGQRLE